MTFFKINVKNDNVILNIKKNYLIDFIIENEILSRLVALRL